ncbi:MAG: MBL fold metallo-hydrolase [Chloroflexi bacterium]|nr:MBL fold metallo-hydrolase [Chloroflexota bacterium]
MPDTTLSRISNHVYWLPPGKPDRPSLGVVVGAGHTLLLDAGASAAHAHLLLAALSAEGIPAPRYVALTHWHWDHVFGASAIHAPLIAHARTARKIAGMAGYEWSDTALEERVASGEETRFSADNIKLELLEPRQVEIVQPEIVFHHRLDIHLGDVTCRIQHVGGDHADDSCVMFIEPDRVLFIGDCLGENLHAPTPYLTRRRLFPLLDTLLQFRVEHIIEGHNPSVMSWAELVSLADQMHLAGESVKQYGADETAAAHGLVALTGSAADADLLELIRSFIAGLASE